MYAPKSIIGVRHVPEFVEKVWEILKPNIGVGTKVGLEPYAYPVDIRYWFHEHAEFYNRLGQLIESEGGKCFPLSKLEIYKDIHEACEIDDKNIRNLRLEEAFNRYKETEIRLAEENKVDYIIVGGGHVPHLSAAFPSADVKLLTPILEDF